MWHLFNAFDNIRNGTHTLHSIVRSFAGTHLHTHTHTERRDTHTYRLPPSFRYRHATRQSIVRIHASRMCDTDTLTANRDRNANRRNGKSSNKFGGIAAVSETAEHTHKNNEEKQLWHTQPNSINSADGKTHSEKIHFSGGNASALGCHRIKHEEGHSDMDVRMEKCVSTRCVCEILWRRTKAADDSIRRYRVLT